MGKHPSISPDTAVENGYSYLTDVSPNDKPWDIHKANSVRVSDLYSKIEYGGYSTRTKLCAQHLGFAFRKDDQGKSLLKLFSARFCRVRNCPICQWRRMLMWRARFFQVIPKLLENYPTHRFVFLTLTVQNCQLEDLRETLNWMNKSWGRMVKRKAFPAVGFVRSTEVTRGKDGLAHPHFHVILMVKSSYFGGYGYLSQEKWTELWKSSLRINYIPVVNVKAVRARKGVDITSISDSIFVGLCETLKYSVKESDLLFDEHWLKGLTQQLYKTRSVSVGGIFKQYLSEEESENLINFGIEDNEVKEDDPKFWFGWKEMVKRYQSI